MVTVDGKRKKMGILLSIIDTITLESNLQMGEVVNEPTLPLSSCFSEYTLEKLTHVHLEYDHEHSLRHYL